ncbi:uncharacterized protein LOC110610792 isoform X2 [Manihot esculenta]|uniref:uncharacterized protein LOC110610792 isoform X2 n=1 Tax=Manihot esculenta TaxID=3983 RepID=UPI000B5D8C06|nr:uncharacterized protein LOC110610792 isoform X2 [Manihot esculenta]
MESPKSTIHALALFLSLSLFICIGFAASGGRIGGNSFSKRSSPRSSSHSSQFSPSNHYCHHHYRHGSTGCSSLSSQNQKIEWEGSVTSTPTWVAVIITIGVVGAISVAVYFEYMHNSGSVIMVQVGLTGKAPSLQKELNEIAETTDTGSPNGWQFILTETTLALLRHSAHFISGYSSVKQEWGVENVEKGFRELSSEERGKMDVESLVNVNNVKMQRPVSRKASKHHKDYIVPLQLIL